jgi:hypothetical protein
MKFYQTLQVVPERFSAPAPLAMGMLLQPCPKKTYQINRHAKAQMQPKLALRALLV